MDRLLRASTAAADAAASPNCLDAETLAAWADGGLDASEAAAVEAHLSSCARCQTMAAAFARTEPEQAASGRLAWWQQGSLRWIVPVAAIAALIVVVVSVSVRRIAAPAPITVAQLEPAQPPARIGPAAPSAPVPPAPAGPTARAAAKAPTGTLGERQRSAEPVSNAANAPVVRPTPSTPALRAPPATAAAKVPELSAPATNETARMFAPANAAPAGPATDRIGGGGQDNIMIDGVAPPAAVGGIAGTAGAPARALGGGGRGGRPGGAAPMIEVVAVSVTDRSNIPILQAASGERSDVIQTEQRSQLPGRQPPMSPPAASATSAPLPLAHWRVRPAGVIERSTDNGVTWSAAEVVTTEAVAITAGAAPANDDCWFVGKAGLVLVTVDGVVFTRTPFPETVDLVAIRATDKRNATVTTTDGRTFTTADGGTSWH